jgi:hypothetical protein
MRLGNLVYNVTHLLDPGGALGLLTIQNCWGSDRRCCTSRFLNFGGSVDRFPADVRFWP